MPTIDDLKKIRKEKLEALQKQGIDPYPATVKREQTIVQARDMDGKSVAVVGRVTAIRGHGKIVFADVADGTGKMQIIWKQDELSSKEFSLVEFLDIGDFVETGGTVGKTQSGEISVFAKQLRIIAKSLRPLPEQWYGFKDIEERYRQRYVDLIVNPAVREIFVTRTKVVQFLRAFLDRDGFLEVETPVLQPIYGGASAKPFVTHHNALDVDLYLRISDELYLKRLIAGGFEKVYEMSKDFRNEGIDRQHNPEFTMLEFYWAYADYEKLMQYTEKMISELVKTVKCSLKITYQGTELDFTPPWPRKSYHDVIKEFTGVDIDVANDEKKLLAAIKEKKIQLDLNGVIGYGALLDTLYKTAARPHLTGPMFLTDRPTAFVALAKRLPADPSKTASFQLLVAGKEILNAYNELNDPIDQEARWRESEGLGQKGQSEHEVVDRDYIRALEYGMPPTAGWGMGIDRLVSLLTDQPNLKDVILFPTLKPENDTPIKRSPEGNKIATKLPELGLGRKQAQELVDKYLKDPINRMHSRESEVIMRAIAKRFGEDEEKWGIIGYLHDIDWELTKDDTKKHCIKTAEILHEAGGTDFLIETIQSHGYGQGFGDEYYGPPEFKGKKRTSTIQHALAAAETLTGLIIATALIQPDKKLASIKPDSLKKKFKNLKFAAGCNRNIILECENIGIPIDDFLSLGLHAIQEIHEELGF